jgi:hypothetical protein
MFSVQYVFAVKYKVMFRGLRILKTLQGIYYVFFTILFSNVSLLSPEQSALTKNMTQEDFYKASQPGPTQLVPASLALL